jgi:hypothetical protein
MPLDLKVLTLLGEGRLVGATWPRPDFVESGYNLLQRIYMNLVTEPGDVEDDPEWGAGIRSAMLGIPGQQIERARQVAAAVLTKCKLDLQQSLSSDPAERLVDLRLEDVEYSTDIVSWFVTATVVSETSVTTLRAG